jgi:thiol-disulfide isomerase/thioredoxin
MGCRMKSFTSNKKLITLMIICTFLFFSLVLFFGISKIVKFKKSNISSKEGNYFIELNSPLPDLPIFRNLSLFNKKYVLITFFGEYCEACADGTRRIILNGLAQMYSYKLEVIGIFEDFSELDIDNFKRLYSFDFKILRAKERFYFKRKGSISFPYYPHSILVDETKNIILIESDNYVLFFKELKEILSKGEE